MLKSLWLLLCYRAWRLFHRDAGEVAAGRKRSPKWPAVRIAYLRENAACEVTGDTTDVDVHHIIPFNVRPDLELDPRNLIALSNKPITAHFLFGHLLDWKSNNPAVREDAAIWRLKVQHRRIMRVVDKLLKLGSPGPKPVKHRKGKSGKEGSHHGGKKA